jgi:hypothetical protein
MIYFNTIDGDFWNHAKVTTADRQLTEFPCSPPISFTTIDSDFAINSLKYQSVINFNTIDGDFRNVLIYQLMLIL